MPLNSAVAHAFFSKFPDLTQTQKNAIPLIIDGNDTLVISGTGSGKTEAVLAPLLSKYWADINATENPVLIYIAPTKALVNDIAKRVSPVISSLNLGVSVRHGDTNDLKLKKKHTVLITTPESFEVLQATKPEIFKDVKGLIIDEAHLLFNQQRGFQLAILISRLELFLESRIQVVAASATISSPESLWKFFRNTEKFSLAKQEGHREIRSQIRIGYTIDKLVELISKLPEDRPIKILIFGDTKRECDSIALSISESTNHNFQVFSHHASLSPEMRKKVELEFNITPHAICVATSTLELGIDIGDINLVILWGKARNWQSFMQRIGRGNRRSSFVEVICMLPDGNQTNISELIGYQSLLKQISDSNFPRQNSFQLFGVICQQICVLASTKEAGFISLSDFANIFRDIEFLDRDLLKEILLDLTERKILVKDPNRMAFGPSEVIHDLRERDLLWSNIPHSASTVPIVLNGNRIGDINSGNLFTLNPGSVFAFAAKRLKVSSFSAGQINLVETSEPINSKLKFGGKLQPLELSLVSAVRDFLREKSYLVMDGVMPVRKALEIRDNLVSQLGDLDLDTKIPFFRSGANFHYITFGGLVLNSALVKAYGNAATTVNDFQINSPIALNFGNFSNDLNYYDSWVAELDLSFGAQTEFQDFLSPQVRAIENISKWHSEAYHSETLARLTSSEVVEVSPLNNYVWS